MASELGDKLLSVKINIAGRAYPLNIKAKEEEIVRKAGRLLNKRLEEFRNNYAADDKDVLAMSALMFAIDSLKTGSVDTVFEDDVKKHLDDVEASLNQFT